MATYTFFCLTCRNTLDLIAHMRDGAPAEIDCPACSGVMIRKYRPVKAVAFSAFEILTDHHIENFNRHKARARGQNVPRFSPDKINRPGKPIPGKDYGTR